MASPFPYSIRPLSEKAVLIDFGNLIDEAVNHFVISLFNHLQACHIKGVEDLVPAYASLAVFYNPLLIDRSKQSAMNTIAETFKTVIESIGIEVPKDGKLHKIPVCYATDFAPDLNFIASEKNISEEEVVSLHTNTIYNVYMTGFLPGFAYLGMVDEKIAVDRKSTPRTDVPAGAVGIAGRQTGIYPLASPGGWQLIGRTPLILFDPAAEPPVLLRPGDRVQFYSISRDEYNNYPGRPA